MKETLENIQTPFTLLKFHDIPSEKLLKSIKLWQGQMETIKYACLGCKHCFPAVATNILNEMFPEANETNLLGCAMEETKNKKWFPIAGEYFAFCEGSTCPVAVSTLASPELAVSLAKARPRELCIVGKTETENIGIDKVIKNTISNPSIQVLLIAGKEAMGHYSGNTMIALWNNGVDENMRVIGSQGRRPVLRNVSREEVEEFREQVQIVDMIGNEDVDTITKRITEVSIDDVRVTAPERSEQDMNVESTSKSMVIPTIQKIVQAKEPAEIEMDKAGYFVIFPQPHRGVITVEHYSYDNKHLRTIEGKDARTVYWTIIENRWVTQLSHAAYLGKELTKAELSMKIGIKYFQDGA
jgi:tetrahydromethanopterin S-methyltransferase subunit A